MIDTLLAVVLLLMVFLAINAAITMPAHEYSYDSRDIKDVQDIMELLSGKIDFTDQSFISEISNILKESKNSKESVREVSKISKEKLDSYNLKNYMFSENNILNSEVLASKGDYSKANEMNVATRTYGDYSYTLSVW